MSGAEIRNPQQIFTIMEGGSFLPGFQQELEKAVAHLSNVADTAGKAKGKIKVTFHMEVEGPTMRLRADITSSLPVLPRRETLVFVGQGGKLSLEHPQQTSLFPRTIEGTVQDITRAHGGE